MAAEREAGRLAAVQSKLSEAKGPLLDRSLPGNPEQSTKVLGRRRFFSALRRGDEPETGGAVSDDGPE